MVGRRTASEGFLWAQIPCGNSLLIPCSRPLRLLDDGSSLCLDGLRGISQNSLLIPCSFCEKRRKAAICAGHRIAVAKFPVFPLLLGKTGIFRRTNLQICSVQGLRTEKAIAQGIGRTRRAARAGNQPIDIGSDRRIDHDEKQAHQQAMGLLHATATGSFVTCLEKSHFTTGAVSAAASALAFERFFFRFGCSSSSAAAVFLLFGHTRKVPALRFFSRR
jgi:hypothetical protein